MPPLLKDSAVLVALITVSGGVVGTLISTISNFFIGKRDNEVKQGQKEIIKSLDVLKNDNIKIKADLASNAEELEKLKKNSKDITRYRLYHDMTKDILNGYTTLENKREIAKLFDSYKMLDGNGEIEMMYKEEFIDLPLRKEKKDEIDKQAI
ncbi:TPA: hypothetical protein U1405_000003 [Streptococcus suis]|uniref:hypothetical protein n=1 Tax=Streptococcus suis TaxID=1307 RepID=UPI00022F92D6|nr:hypothetical protein [Streptococcus suis]AGE61208.1 hypothetical protein ST1_003 [Streptococcus phage phiST1]AER21666.1 hypothetical protein SSUST1_1310 [Streptococcus suis ST1]MDW8592803.1 hypothetical protein [Streptococcus suis]MDW8622328.1 hypothetical protein [Streptococcus suis]NQK00162.1 hypothetical protein [Streptococcus suis]